MKFLSPSTMTRSIEGVCRLVYHAKKDQNGDMLRFQHHIFANRLDRINVGGPSINDTEHDPLRRKWNPDDPFLFTNGAPVNYCRDSIGDGIKKNGQKNEKKSLSLFCALRARLAGVGVVLVLVLGFLIGSKYRKSKPVVGAKTESNMVSSYGRSLSISMDFTKNHPSPIPNMNLKPLNSQLAELYDTVIMLSRIGYCDRQKYEMPCVEFMKKGTLQDHLYDTNENHPKLSWTQRLEICISASRGLDYLHTGAGIIHRDVKSKTIVCWTKKPLRLDSLSWDFGISLLNSEEDNEVSGINAGLWV
ncbi:probable receptor-like protein kinase [Tanacetum coccineum]